MQYFIHYEPVFSRKKTFTGYNMFVSKKDTSDLEHVLSVECSDEVEFERFNDMLKSVYDPFDHIAFVDKHPVQMLNYLRGEKEPIKRTPDWENQVGEWSVNLRGERV